MLHKGELDSLLAVPAAQITAKIGDMFHLVLKLYASSLTFTTYENLALLTAYR